MFKILGGGLIIFASFLYSRMKAEEIKKRIEFADGLLAGFVALEEQVCGLLMPLERAFLYAAYPSGAAAEVFGSAADGAGGAYERFSSVLGEKSEFAESILPYINGITALEEEERRCAFSLIRTRLEEKRKLLSEELFALGRLYGAVGIPIGVLIVILLY